MDAINNIFNKIFDVAGTFGLQEWGIICAITVLVGYMCLRGMSIR